MSNAQLHIGISTHIKYRITAEVLRERSGLTRGLPIDMKYDVTHILTSLKNDVEGTENEKTQIYLIQLDVAFRKKPMVKSVIYLLFSYQTGYIM